MSNQTKKNIPVVPRNILFPFILLTSCFAWWGLANNMTDTLLPFFKRMMSMSDFQTSWIQMAFYGAYFCLAIPAALIVQRFSYKVGVLFGLGMFTIGGLLFYPSGLLFETASDIMRYTYFLVSLYIFAGGCSILETSANTYVLAMGAPETATRRLNLAQSFNPVGSILGVLILSKFLILPNLTPLDPTDRSILNTISAKSLDVLQLGELQGAIVAYVGFALLLVVVWFAIFFCKMPVCSAAPLEKGFAKNIWNFLSIPFDAFHFNKGSFFYQMKDILSHRNYLWGVIAQFFYVGAQICVWSYTIRYVMQEINILETSASSYYIYGLLAFVGMRFVCTFLMRYISPNMLLMSMSILAILCCLPVMFIGGMFGVVSLICISGCMSLMFPTIYGIASEGLGEKMKLGGCGLIMAILGGAVITAIQGRVSDATSINFSYIVPACCFVIVGYFGLMTEKGAIYSDGKTSMPRIPGKLLTTLGVCTVAVVAACIFVPKSGTLAKSAQHKQGIIEKVEGLNGCYACAISGEENAFNILEVVPVKEKLAPGEFKGVVRHYKITNPNKNGHVNVNNIQYNQVGICEGTDNKLSTAWLESNQKDSMTYDPKSDSLTMQEKTYKVMPLHLDHLTLTTEIQQARLAMSNKTTEE